MKLRGLLAGVPLSGDGIDLEMEISSLCCRPEELVPGALYVQLPGAALTARQALDRGAADNGGMVRIDVFEREGKYYCVPVYIKDIYAKHLPDRAISAGKRFDDWVKIDDSFRFLFALFRNDLIYVKAKKPFNLSPNDKEEKQSVSVSEGFFYYRGIDCATGAALLIVHDNSYSTRLGFKTLLKIEKYAVDILGNKYPVKREKRLNTEWDS